MSRLEEIKVLLPDNNSGAITEARLRESFEKTFSEMDTKATKEELKKVEDKVKAGTPTLSVNNKLAGKKISFIGDSITSWGESAVNEYTPTKGYVYEDVWTAQFLSLTGGVKATLDSRAGSRVTGIDGDAFAFSRTKVVAQDSDYIFIFMGANDQRALNVPTNGVPLGEIKDKASLGDITNASNPNLKKFTEAYQLALENMLPYYKKSQIILMTPLRSFHNGAAADQNKDSDKLAERIIDIAKMYGIKWIDMREVGITKYNHEIYFYDGLHPNKRGHRLIAEYVTSKMLEFGVVGKLEASDYYTKTQIDEKLKALPKGNGSTSSEDIVIGGANLLKNTALPLFAPNNTSLSDSTGISAIMSDATGSFVRYTPASHQVVGVYGFEVKGLVAGTHSRSMDFRHSHTGNVTIWGQSIPPNVWTRVKQEAFNLDSSWMGAFTSDVQGVAVDIRNFKLEKGTKATDWVPHISEYNLGNSDTMVDTVLPWTHDLDVAVETNGDNNLVVYKLPRIESFAEILEFRLIQRSGTVIEIKGLKVITTSTGRKGVALKSAEIGDPVKVYVKALLK